MGLDKMVHMMIGERSDVPSMMDRLVAQLTDLNYEWEGTTASSMIEGPVGNLLNCRAIKVGDCFVIDGPDGLVGGLEGFNTRNDLWAFTTLQGAYEWLI